MIEHDLTSPWAITQHHYQPVMNILTILVNPQPSNLFISRRHVVKIAEKPGVFHWKPNGPQHWWPLSDVSAGNGYLRTFQSKLLFKSADPSYHPS